MGKIRSLTQQLNYCISQSCHIGESKRQYKMQNNGKTEERVFSVQYAENLRKSAKSLANFIKENYPDVKMARDINSKHVQSWLNDNAENWSKQTIINKISQIEKIAIQINSTYSANVTLKLHQPEGKTNGNIRNVAFKREDFEKVNSLLKEGTSQSIKAAEITARCGLRVKEVAHLKTERINLDKKVIEIREGGKNGKWRDIPIRDKDMAYFTDLKDNCHSLYVTEGVQEDSLNDGIRRKMKKLGISEKYKCTTEHAIRKMYARERMQEERNKGKSEQEAWKIVKYELGHGDDDRPKLYKTYVGK